MDGRHVLIVLATVCSAIVTVSGSTKCLNDLTTIIEGSNNGRNKPPDDYSYRERINDTHYRVCQCEVKPCLKKCCGRGEYMVNDICQVEPTGVVFLSNVFPTYDQRNFHLVYGKGCPANHFARFYPGDYTNVNYYLLMNGSISIFFDSEMRQVDDFCLEKVLRTGNGSSNAPPSLLICIPKDYSPGFYDFPLGMTLSLPFLLATLIVYSFRELKSLHSRNLTSHVASLMTAYLSVIAVEMTKMSIPEGLCIALGFLRQFSFLSSFFWLNVMCFDLWWSLSAWSDFRAHSKEKERKKTLAYSVCGWGCPAVIVLTTAIMQFSPTPQGFIKPDIGFPNCFLRDGRPFYAYFYGPVIFIFCTDVTLFILSAVRFITAKRKMRLASAQEKVYIQGTKTRYILLLKIFVMMGVNWIIDPFSWIFESSFWTWLFIHLSIILQAVGIFFIFVWKTEIRNIIATKFCRGSYGQITSISLLHAAPPRTWEMRRRDSEYAQTTTC